MTEFRGPFGSRGMGSLIKWVMSPEGSEAHRKYFEQLEKDNMFNVTVPHQDCICYKCKDRKDNSMTNKKCTCKDIYGEHVEGCGYIAGRGMCDCHPEQRKSIYTAGDEVTLCLTQEQACQMNKYDSFGFLSGEIIRHEPVKPITHKLTVIKFEDGKYSLASDVGPRAKVIHELLVTYNPHTKEASIEVVK